VTPGEVERQIANLVFGLAEAIDDGDHERIEQLFGEATFQLGDREPRVGGAAFRRTIAASAIHYDGRPRTLHAVTNLQIDLDDARTSASSKAYVTVFQCLPDFPLQAVMTGRYHDRFLADDAGEWHWIERRMTIDHLGDTSRHTKTQL
jgi:hypothetical protein